MLNLNIDNHIANADWYFDYLEMHLVRKDTPAGPTYLDSFNNFTNAHFGMTYESFIKLPFEQLLPIKDFFDSQSIYPRNIEIEKSLGFYDEFAAELIGIGPETRDLRITAFDLMTRIGNPISCPYCNSNIIVNVDTINGRRSQLDHFFPKTVYPALALCFYNLVPICPSCNGHKGTKTFDASPYSATNLAEMSKFGHIGDHRTNLHFSLFFHPERLMVSNAKHLGLENVYQNSHTDIIKDLLEVAYSNPQSKLEMECNSAGRNFNLTAELQRVFTLSFHEHPSFRKTHSKIFHDILKSIYDF